MPMIYVAQIKTKDGWQDLSDKEFTYSEAIIRYGTWLKDHDSPVRLRPVRETQLA